MTMRRLSFAALILLGLWHLGLRARALSVPMTSDEGEYAYEALVLSHGGTPYLDAYDQKPPLVFFLYRAAFMLFGENSQAPRLLAAIFSLFTIFLLYLMTPESWSYPARLAAPAAFAVMSPEPIGDMGLAANTEIFMAAFTALGAWLLLRTNQKLASGGVGRKPSQEIYAFGAGVSLGAALMTKQTAIWTCAAFAAVALTTPKRTSPKRFFYYLGGCVVIPALFIGFFWSRGALGVFWMQVFRRNMDYASLIVDSPYLGWHLRSLAQNLLPQLLSGDWPYYLLALTGLGLTRLSVADGVELLAALWLASAWIGVATGLYFFPHYFIQATPALALAAALGFNQVLGRRPARLQFVALLFVAVFPALVHAKSLFFEPPRKLARVLLYPNPVYESLAAANFIRARAANLDRAYVFGSEPEIYVESGLGAATPHIFVYPLTLFPQGPKDILQEETALENGQPRFVVFVAEPTSTLISGPLGEAFRDWTVSWLKREYRCVGAVPIRPWIAPDNYPEPQIEPLTSGEQIDWDAKNRMYVFERKIHILPTFFTSKNQEVLLY